MRESRERLLDERWFRGAAILTSVALGATILLVLIINLFAFSNGSVISAVMFGALAGSKALPFRASAYEAAIERGGVGVKASLTAFHAGLSAPRPKLPPPRLSP